jgi:hypothetical protein
MENSGVSSSYDASKMAIFDLLLIGKLIFQQKKIK